ncbi:unnamed protein product [Merluccius merluccius]
MDVLLNSQSAEAVRATALHLCSSVLGPQSRLPVPRRDHQILRGFAVVLITKETQSYGPRGNFINTRDKSILEAGRQGASPPPRALQRCGPAVRRLIQSNLPLSQAGGARRRSRLSSSSSSYILDRLEAKTSRPRETLRHSRPRKRAAVIPLPFGILLIKPQTREQRACGCFAVSFACPPFGKEDAGVAD